MALGIETITVDCTDPSRVSAFWAGLLGYQVVPNHTDSIQTADPTGVGPRILFTHAGSAKRDKNRLHLDLRPDDQPAAVERALALGASQVDIGQSRDESWVVLADPEGNEFCILQSRADYESFRANRSDG